MLSELGFSGRHAKQSVWVLMQKYNTVCKDLYEQTKWVALCHCKDRLSFTDALDENDVVPHELRNSLRTSLAEAKHTKLVLKTDQSSAYAHQNTIAAIILHHRHQLKDTEAALFCVVISLQLAILCILGYGVRDYIRLKYLVRILKMDCNDLLAQLIEEERPADTALPPTTSIPIETVSSRDTNHKRARLAALAAGGQTKLTFKGHIVNTERVDAMTDTEVEEVYTRYEAHLGAMMTKSLGASLLRLYASAASILLPLPPERQLALVADLEKDPFVSSALKRACCEF